MRRPPPARRRCRDHARILSVPDQVPDEDDMDPARILLVVSSTLPTRASHAVRGEGAPILERRAELSNRTVQRLLRPGDEDHIAGAPGVRGELATRSRGDHEPAALATAYTLPSE
jgi:hypothetical protein